MKLTASKCVSLKLFLLLNLFSFMFNNTLFCEGMDIALVVKCIHDLLFTFIFISRLLKVAAGFPSEENLPLHPVR